MSFGRKKMEYLGYFILGVGVETNPQKIQAIISWHVPTKNMQLRSFLGLPSYYRKFIQR